MKYFALVVMLGCCLNGWGQDTIVLSDKSKILAKVLKVNEYGIKYTNWGDKNGPKYHLELSIVLKIKYKHGAIEVFDHNTGGVHWVQRSELTIDSTESTQQNIVTRPDPNSYKFIGQDTLVAPNNIRLHIPDTIMLKNNSMILARVLEISENSIKYRRWDDIDGPAYLISIADIAGIKCFGHNNIFDKTQIADTIILAGNIKIPARILNITTLRVKYNNMVGSDKPASFIAMNKIIMIRYHDGHTVMQSDMIEADNGWRDRRSSYGATYDSLMYIHHIKYALGAGLTTTGAVVTVVGFGCLTGLTASPGLQITGICLMASGIGILVGGIIELGLAGKYRRTAISFRNGLVYLSLPQPDYILPTAQNNFEKGFGVRTGITF